MGHFACDDSGSNLDYGGAQPMGNTGMYKVAYNKHLRQFSVSTE